MEELIINAISNIGVPAAICFFLLVKVNRSLDELTKAVLDLSYTLKESRK